MRDEEYKKEFLDYLKNNGLKTITIFNERKSEYSTFEKRVIDIITNSIDDLLTQMSSAREIEPWIKAYCVDDSSVNAFCFKTDNRFYIGIYAGTYIEILNRAQALATRMATEQVLEYSLSDVDQLQVSLWDYAFKMILAHEYMHIILGHCEIEGSAGAFLWERNSNTNSVLEATTFNKRRQALEMFADEFAAMDIAGQIVYNHQDSIPDIKRELLKYYLSLLLVYSIFDDEIPEKYRCHPRLGVRLHYITATVDNLMYMRLQEKSDKVAEIVEEIDEVIDEFMEIIRRFSDLFDYDIVTALGVSDIDKDYIELYNTAADIVKETNNYAVYPVNEFDKVDRNMWFGINEERDLIEEAVRNGKSYEELNQIIKNKKSKRDKM